MPITTTIKGAKDGSVAKVATNGGLCVVVAPRPPSQWTAQEVEQKKSLVGLLATAAGSSDLGVDGSVTEVDFVAGAPAAKIHWVTEVRLTLHSSLMKLDSNEIRRFGPAAAAPGLTNGLRLIARQNGAEVDLWTSAGVKNLGDFYRYSETVQGVTDGVSAGVDFVVVRLILPVPIGLYPGSKDQVILRIQDDLTTLTLFEAVCLGWSEDL